jgi:plastocyanin
MRKPVVVAILVALPGWLPGLAPAGVIRGVVRVPAERPPIARVANAYPGQAHSMPGMHEVARGEVGDAVVYVEKVPAFAESVLAAVARPAPRFAQKNQAFVPRVLVIAAGTVVEFPNQDPIYHNVFSLSPTKRFDLGKYRQGKSKPVRFERAGLVNVYCDIHSDMEGFILVLPNHAFARPDPERGAFAMPDLPPGTYVVKAWHPDLRELSRTVEVPAHGDVDVELVF